MRCINCGKEITDNAKFCSYCGVLQDNENRVEESNILSQNEPQSPVVKGSFISGKQLLIVLLAIIAVIIVIMIGTQKDTENTDEVSYEVSDTSLEEISKYDIAMDFYKDEQLDKAILMLDEVPFDDENYNQAQKKLEIIKSEYKESQLKSAKELNNEEKYEEAITILEYTIVVLKEDSEVAELLKDISLKYSEICNEKGFENFYKKEYEEAAKYFEIANKYNNTNENAAFADMTNGLITNVYTSDNLPEGVFWMENDKYYRLREGHEIPWLIQEFNSTSVAPHIRVEGIEKVQDLFVSLKPGDKLVIKGSKTSYTLTQPTASGFVFPYIIRDFDYSEFYPFSDDEEGFSGTVNGSRFWDLKESSGWKYRNGLYWPNLQYGDTLLVTGYEGTTYFEKEIEANVWAATYEALDWTEKAIQYDLVTQKTQEGYFYIELPENVPSGIYKLGDNYKSIYIYIYNSSMQSETTSDRTDAVWNANYKYTNVALYGLDSAWSSIMNTKSTAVTIVSICEDTGDVRFINVWPDLLLRYNEGKIGQVKKVYSYAGVNESLEMLNSNLDLDISDYISVGTDGFAKIVDALGGIEVFIDAEELDSMNNYQFYYSDEMRNNWINIEEEGNQRLNGYQTAAYCLVDMNHSIVSSSTWVSRQQEVFEDICKKIQQSDSETRQKIADIIYSDAFTSLMKDDVEKYVDIIAKESVIESAVFPKESMSKHETVGSNGFSTRAYSLTDSVVDMHKELFEKNDYTPSEEVQVISDELDAYVQEKTQR